MSRTRTALRTLLLLVCVLTTSCSGKDKKEGTDDKKVSAEERKQLKGDALVQSFEGERKSLAIGVYLVGDAYQQATDLKGNPPASLKDLEGLYSTDEPEKLKKQLKDDIDFVWNAKLTGKSGGEKIVVVYERNADKDGNRVVMPGKGELRFLGDTEFQAALKAAKE